VDERMRGFRAKEGRPARARRRTSGSGSRAGGSEVADGRVAASRLHQPRRRCGRFAWKAEAAATLPSWRRRSTRMSRRPGFPWVRLPEQQIAEGCLIPVALCPTDQPRVIELEDVSAFGSRDHTAAGPGAAGRRPRQAVRLRPRGDPQASPRSCPQLLYATQFQRAGHGATSSPNQLARRLEPNSRFSAASSSDGPSNVPFGGSPLLASMFTRPTQPRPNST
jgi:hypothetical protein